MKQNDSGIQLEMNFGGEDGNLFRSRLNSGSFQVLVEVNTPSADSLLKDAVARAAPIEFMALAHKPFPVALAFVETPRAAKSMDMVQFASALCQTSRNAHLLFINGRDQTEKKLLSQCSYALNEGFKSICAVSGTSVPGENARQTFRRTFMESVNILHLLNEEYPGKFHAGATVNPFKYTPADDYAQFFKMVKKINFGASFITAQCGWDMPKLQELRWSLTRRVFHVPLMARIAMLTPEKAEEICVDRMPGVHISSDFQKVLRHEAGYSKAQFEAAQLRRLQIHVAGAKLLGFSGIQLTGIERPELLSSALTRISEVFAEIHSFSDWCELYNDYYGQIDMTPYPHRFYMFEELFAKSNPNEHPPAIRNVELTPCSMMEKFRRKTGAALFSHAHELPAQERRLTKKLLFSCKSCKNCRLPLTDYICPEHCPKGMANGPCGCSKTNGHCEFSDSECIFALRLRIAHHKHDYTSLEESRADNR